jgi:hypothetical protein
MAKKKTLPLIIVVLIALLTAGVFQVLAWDPLPVEDDPLLRMPGTQPDQGVDMLGPGQCMVCHGGYDPEIEPGFTWQGSMMAQAGRDFLFWAAMTAAGQDSIWALGNPNGTDLCIRCHMPGGWLAGRSDPTNASDMTGIDLDGITCNLCHSLYDPFYETTFDGTREGDDWAGYWDESNARGTPSNAAAENTYNSDRAMSTAIEMFNGQPFYAANIPPVDYTENGSGQFFVSTEFDDRRASFADGVAPHEFKYSRYHKSKFLCSTCHDISNPVLQNIGADPTQPLPTETEPSYSYYHVERTFSEFMLSDFGQQGGAAGIGPFAPNVFETSRPNNYIASCQDCHMADVEGRACRQTFGVIRPDESIEHPNSGLPTHDLTGGNLWVSAIVASAVPGSPNYDAINDALLNQGANVLTMDLTQGDVFIPVALLAGAERAEQNLRDAAVIQDLIYDAVSGELSFKVQNQTGHKLISGYPEGRRMYLNIRFFDDQDVMFEINPYDSEAGTLKGLSGFVYEDPDGILPEPEPLGPDEEYVGELVYEMHSSSSLTGEEISQHFILSTERQKDNRIPPMGYRVNEAVERISEPVWDGIPMPDYFTAAEYAGGYDAVNLADYGIAVPGASFVSIGLYYQTTSREYMEFLRNEINGEGELTLPSPGAGGDPAYLIQTDPFFSQLRAWGDTIWQLWRHNKDLPGGAPVVMTYNYWGIPTDVTVSNTIVAHSSSILWPIGFVGLVLLLLIGVFYRYWRKSKRLAKQ